MIIEILALIVPTAIAIVSLYYVIKQRSLVKSEIAKKRYLESALSNLNEALKSLRDLDVPNINEASESYEVWGDMVTDVHSVIADILRASFIQKTKRIVLEVSYSARSIPESSKTKSVSSGKSINLEDLEPTQFIDFLRTNLVFIESKISIDNFRRFWRNDLDFVRFIASLEDLKKARKRLLSYEEVYESVCPNSLKKVNQFFEELAEGIFHAIRKPKRLVIDLDKFIDTNEMMKYLLEEIMNYSHIADKISKVSKLISELTEARKELFLKIS